MTGHSILVVDDDAHLASNIAYMLAPLDVETTIAGTKYEALERAQERQFDVAILDLFLPDGDGAELVPALRARDPNMEVVIVTGNATVASAAMAVRTQAVDYLVKPFTSTELVGSVRSAIARSERRRDLDGRLRDARMTAIAELSTGLAHHLRNPLNAALLQLGVARRHAVGNHSSMDQVEFELRRLARIIADFEACLVVSTARHLPEISVAELWTNVDEDVRMIATANVVEIVGDVPPDLRAALDRDSMRLALGHLARNAIEAMTDGGRLAFRARETADALVLEIEDTGPGIPDTRNVFDAFYSTKPSGTGLGLTIVHRVVMEHGGSVRVASRPGRTTFVIEIPRSARTS
ncbi:MAG: response regulator [Kofleriaceae bacterium]